MRNPLLTLLSVYVYIYSEYLLLDFEGCLTKRNTVKGGERLAPFFYCST